MASAAFDRFVVGRQTIRDRSMDVVGHELLIAELDCATTGITTDVLLGASDSTLSRLVGDKTLHLAADRTLLLEDADRTTLPPGRTVLGIEPAAGYDEPVLDTARKLAARGFTIALDDFRWSPAAEQLLEVASLVKVDVQSTGPDERVDLARRCKPFKVRLLAANVETPGMIGDLVTQGFELFQGYTVQRATVDPERRIGAVNPARLASSVRMLGLQLDFFEIEEFLRTEPGLTYQVLRLASLGRPGETRRKVNTLRDALVLVGTWRIQGWIALLLARPDTLDGGDAITTALVRARACEMLAGAAAESARAGFAAGMISSFEEVLQIPSDELARTLPLADDLRAAAFGTQTPLGRVVRDIADRHAGRRAHRLLCGLTTTDLDTALASAFEWAVLAGDALD
jgi:EAL and modified HD-GYP domain-containing signal transduction protein